VGGFGCDCGWVSGCVFVSGCECECECGGVGVSVWVGLGVIVGE